MPPRFQVYHPSPYPGHRPAQSYIVKHIPTVSCTAFVSYFTQFNTIFGYPHRRRRNVWFSYNFRIAHL